MYCYLHDNINLTDGCKRNFTLCLYVRISCGRSALNVVKFAHLQAHTKKFVKQVCCSLAPYGEPSAAMTQSISLTESEKSNDGT